MKKTKWISSVLIFFAVFLLVLVGCEQPGTDQSGSNNSGTGTESTTQIVIKNQSSHDLRSVVWNGYSSWGNYSPHLDRGESGSNTVEADSSSYIYFTLVPLYGYEYEYQTKEIFIAEKGQKTEFTIIDNTIVVYRGTEIRLGELHQN